jgi:hypothetical protein
VLLLAPPSEALDWDLCDEVASTGRYWMADRQAWWVATPYATTAIAIATRFNGGRPPVQERPALPGAAPRRKGAPQIEALQPMLQRLLEWSRSLLPRTREVAPRGVRAR